VVFPTFPGRWLKALPPLRQSHRGGAGKGYGTMKNTWVFRVLTRFESWELDGFWALSEEFLKQWHKRRIRFGHQD